LAWLTVHHAIAALIATAAKAADLDPDRISFTNTLRLVRRTAIGTADIPPSALDRRPAHRPGPDHLQDQSTAAAPHLPARRQTRPPQQPQGQETR